jgi:regulator of protease activity HflC (stomatin/prohibitin superfamily)
MFTLTKKQRIILLTISFLIAFYYVFNYIIAFERIDAGNAGIRVNLVGSDKGVDDITEATGWVVYIPAITAIYEFPTFTQTKDYEPFNVNAKDGGEFTVDPTFSYYVETKSVPSIFKRYRRTLPELENGYLKNVIYDSFRIAANGFTSDSLVSNRQIFEELVQKNLTSTLKNEGFVFQQLTSNMDPPTSLKEAINAKNKSTQEAIQSENKVRQAEADAKIKKIRADADKYENDMKSSALSSLIIQQMFIDKWDGKLPVYGETPKLFKDINK